MCSYLFGGKLEFDGMSWHLGMNWLSNPELRHLMLLTICESQTCANKITYHLTSSKTRGIDKIVENLSMSF